MSKDSKIDRLSIIEKKTAIARNIFLIIILGLFILVAVIFGGNYGYIAYRNYHDSKVAAEIRQKAEQRLELLKKGLSEVKGIGDVADFGDIQLTLLEEKKLDVISVIENGTTGRIPLEKYRLNDYYGLHFKVKNTSTTAQTWNREMGWLVTEDNLHQVVVPYPFKTEYLYVVGETYTFANRDLLIGPNIETTGWIVIEVSRSTNKPVFAYPASKKLVGYWPIL